MTTTLEDIEAATPSVMYVPGENIELVIESYDGYLARLLSLDRQGNYVKIDRVFDILLDMRDDLKGLLRTD